MSSDEGDEDFSARHPRETTVWFGHAEAERMLLEAYAGGRMPHAWLIGGPPGIGKATLAYRLARFVLAHPHGQDTEVRSTTSLDLPPDHRVIRQIAAQGHPDLLVLERTLGERDTLRSVIAVDDVRRTIPFFGSTAGEGGWRIVIVDSADELNAAGANSLLKLVEEPPARALFLIVSHAPGRVLATMRSRCRRLSLRPLAEDGVARAVAAAIGVSPDDHRVRKAAAVAEGSVGRAVAMLGGPLMAVRERVVELLARLPTTDPRALHALGENLERADRAVLGIFVDTVRDWLTAQVRVGARTGAATARLARLADAWDKISRSARETEVFNLERKPLVFNVFGWLAEAARG